jgi:hypothetical protein
MDRPPHRRGGEGRRQARVAQVGRSIESWILAGLSAGSPKCVADPEGGLEELMLRRAPRELKEAAKLEQDGVVEVP